MSYDLMSNPDGTFVCANWCDDGRVKYRGDLCWRCRFDGANHLIINCANTYYDEYVEVADGTRDPMLVEAALDDLFDAVEAKRKLTLEYKEEGSETSER